MVGFPHQQVDGALTEPGGDDQRAAPVPQPEDGFIPDLGQQNLAEQAQAVEA